MAAALAVAVLLVASAVLSGAARAAELRPATVRAYVHAGLAAWDGLSQPDGGFREAMKAERPASYGPTLLGFTYINEGLRAGDQAMVDRGIRAFSPTLARGRTLPFDLLAIPSAFALLERTQMRNPLWWQTRPLWLRFFDTWQGKLMPTDRACLRDDACYTNWKLVRAVGDMGLLRLGLQQRVAVGSALAHPEAILGDVDRTVNGLAPAHVLSWPMTPYGPGAYLSDPGLQPLAYSVFSSVQLNALARQYPGLVRSDLAARTARFVRAAAAPDGDVAYMGRSYEQSWTLAAAVLLGLQAAEHDPVHRASYLRLSRLAWQRLVAYGHLHGTIALTPSARQTGGSYRGLDVYATSRSYNGLPLYFLSLALDLMERHPDWDFAGQPDPPTASFVDRAGGLAWSRSPRLWFALHRQGQRITPDLRYSDGLLLIKVQRRGVWRDLIPGLPFARGATRRPGPRLTRRGRSGALQIDDIRRIPGGFATPARFVSPGGRVVGRSVIRWITHGNRLVASLRVPRGATLTWRQALGPGRSDAHGYVGSGLRVAFDRAMRVHRTHRAAPTALLATARVHEWRRTAKRAERLRISWSAS